MVVFPKLGLAELLRPLLEKEIHFELGSSASALAMDAQVLIAPKLIRKRVFTKGFVRRLSDMPSATFGYVADAGEISATQTLAATRLAAMRHLLYPGDMVYTAPTVPNVTAAIAAFNSWRVAERLYPAFGNHDQDDAGGLTNILTLFPYLTSARYYTRTIGYDPSWATAGDLVHLSSYHSGRNTAMDATEPDGTGVDSLQAITLKALANASSAPWKVLIVHHPPTTGGANYLEELSHLTDGTWDLILCGHAHRNEEIDIGGRCRILNVSTVKENRGSSDLQGTPGAFKLWSDNISLAATKMYVTANTIAWDVIDITSGSIIRQSHIRKGTAPAVYVASDNVRYFMVAEPTASFLMTVAINPTDLPVGTTVRQLGVYVGGSSEIISPGIELIPMDDITLTGSPISIEDGLAMVHVTTTAKRITRVINL